MARTWLSLTVELLGGRGEELWPWPGRIFAVGPSHTFMDLANAINDAFARWDRSHLSMFTLADGRVITDEETGAEMAGSIGGPIIAPIDLAAAKVARTLEPGAEFQFTFDLGVAWTHRCVIGEGKVDPLEILGIRPDAPLPYWGWGSIPDQYGRRWATDDGESRAPGKPGRPHPMLLHAWPAQVQVPGLDLSELREAIAAADAARFLAAVTGATSMTLCNRRGRHTDGAGAETPGGRAGGTVGHQPADVAVCWLVPAARASFKLPHHKTRTLPHLPHRTRRRSRSFCTGNQDPSPRPAPATLKLRERRPGTCGT